MTLWWWLAGCGAGDPMAVVDAQLWRVAEDPAPFPPAPVDVTCDPAGLTFEVFGPEPSLEVWTDACPWATAEQPSLVAVRRGRRLFLRLWHEPLSAPEPSEAVIGLAFGSTVIETWTVPIPSPGAAVLGEWEAPETWPAGTPVRFHVRNHGNNAYNLLEITTGGPWSEE